MKKIILLNTLYPPYVLGGAERSVAVLAKALVYRGYSVSVIALHPQTDSLKVEKRDGVKIYFVPITNVYFPFFSKKKMPLLRIFWHIIDIYNPFMANTVKKILELETPDIFHSNVLTGFSVAVWKKARQLGLPVCHTLRDYSLLCPRSTMFHNHQNCKEICARCKFFSLPKIQATSQVTGVVSNSQYVLRRHLLNGAFSNIKLQDVIYNAFDPMEFSTGSKPQKNNKITRFGYFGRLEENKGIEVLLTVFKQTKHNSIELWIGGKGADNYESNLKTKYVDERIRYLGFINPKDFYPNIDVLIQPSLWHEPLSRTIIEAYSWGKPVIASKRGGSMEIVDEGITGLLFEPESPQELLNCLDMMATTPSLVRAMSQNAVIKSREFLPETIAKRYEKFYEKILGRN
jgi:glycosyltransferase involved in cell wall biosynthesis